MAIMFSTQGPSEVNVDLSGSKIAAQEAQSIIQRQANKTSPMDVVNVGVKIATNIGEAAKAEEKARIKRANQQGVLDANQAKADVNDLYTSEVFRVGNSGVKHDMITNILNQSLQGREPKSEAYVNALKGYVSAKYATATNGLIKEAKTSALDFAAGAYQSWKGGVGVDGTISNFNEGYAATYESIGVTAKEVGLMVGADLVRQGNELILEANTDEELAEAIANADDLTEGLQDNTAALSNNKEVVAFYTRAGVERNAAIKVTEAKIVLNAKNRLATVDKEGNVTHPLEVNKDLEIAYKDPIELEKKKQSYQKTYDDTIELNTHFAENYDITVPSKTVPPIDNPKYKERNQTRITEGLTIAWEDNQPSIANDIVNSNPGFASEFGGFLLGKINSTKSNEELTELVDYVKQLDSSVATRMFSDSQDNQMLGLEGLSIAYPDKSIT